MTIMQALSVEWGEILPRMRISCLTATSANLYFAIFDMLPCFFNGSKLDYRLKVASAHPQ